MYSTPIGSPVERARQAAGWLASAKANAAGWPTNERCQTCVYIARSLSGLGWRCVCIPAEEGLPKGWQTGLTCRCDRWRRQRATINGGTS